MGIIVNKNQNEEDELSQRIHADLRAKMTESSNMIENEELDPAKDSDYVKDLNGTSKHAWIWTVLIVLAIISLIVIALI